MNMKLPFWMLELVIKGAISVEALGAVSFSFHTVNGDELPYMSVSEGSSGISLIVNKGGIEIGLDLQEIVENESYGTNKALTFGTQLGTIRFVFKS